jgi:hypothetical protein
VAKRKGPADPAAEAFEAGWCLVVDHPIFRPFSGMVGLRRVASAAGPPPDALAVLLDDGTLMVHPTRRESAETWAFAVAHQFCHLGFGHLSLLGSATDPDVYDRAACCLVVNRFLAGLKLVTVPDAVPLTLPEGEEITLARRW